MVYAPPFFKGTDGLSMKVVFREDMSAKTISVQMVRQDALDERCLPAFAGRTFKNPLFIEPFDKPSRNVFLYAPGCAPDYFHIAIAGAFFNLGGQINHFHFGIRRVKTSSSVSGMADVCPAAFGAILREELGRKNCLEEGVADP